MLSVILVGAICILAAALLLISLGNSRVARIARATPRTSRSNRLIRPIPGPVASPF